MASETRKFEVTLPLETWKKMKRLCDTGRGKKYKDPAEVFKVGLENICQINNVK